MVVQGNVLLALHAVHRMGFCTSSRTCSMIAIILQNYSKVKQARAHLIEQVGVSSSYIKNLLKEN